MKKFILQFFSLFFLFHSSFAFDGINDSTAVPGQWSIERINNWYNDLPWLVGCNYYPSTAINQIEMWQASTWDPETIEKELELAASIGMNTLRVYLHDLVWEDDEEGLYARMDEFLTICQKYNIRPWFVFFDDCHFPTAQLGEQPLPVRKYHNSGWVNSPVRELAIRYAKNEATKEEVAKLKGYVQKTMQRFADDSRVLMWELYNEPGRGHYMEPILDEQGRNLKFGDESNKLVYDSWVWAREVNPSQPVTSTTAGSVGDRNIRINRINSDLHSIHYYGTPEETKNLIIEYKKDDRPVIMSEWLARDRGNTVEGCLPMFKELNVGAVNWGFVSGKTGTVWPWSSRNTEDGRRDVAQERDEGNVVREGEAFPEPDLWFHDLFRIDGSPFDENEIRLFKRLTGVEDN
jgi:hypothetical protein